MTRSGRFYYACFSLLKASHRASFLSHAFVRACFAGVWLDVLKRESLMRIGDLFYAAHKRYQDDCYNQHGLWVWEAALLERFFPKGRLLLVGAGGGRETVELGDDLEPKCVHYFTPPERASELKAADSELVYYSAQPYGHAVAFAR